MAQFAIIGLGRFGARASLELLNLGHAVIGVDNDAKLVDALADDLTHSAIADVTDERALKELNLASCDAVLVAIGEDLQASLLCVLHLKNMGVKEIWAKATSKEHHMILTKLGVNRIVHPEEEMGIRIAQSLNYPMVNDYLALGHNWFIVEVDASESLDGEPLKSVLGDEEEHLHALLVKRKDQVFASPQDELVLKHKDLLVLAGSLKALKSIAERLE